MSLRQAAEAEAELQRAASLIGYEAYRNNPICHAALQTIRYGASAEDALAAAVRSLAMQNDQMMRDMVAIASSRPQPIIIQPPEQA